MKEPLKLASPHDWKAACVSAAVALAKGEDGLKVERGEPWPYAIARVAADLMTSMGYGRPPGEADREWVTIPYTVARFPSTAPDGLVAAWGGMRLPISALPRPERQS